MKLIKCLSCAFLSLCTFLSLSCCNKSQDETEDSEKTPGIAGPIIDRYQVRLSTEKVVDYIFEIVISNNPNLNPHFYSNDDGYYFYDSLLFEYDGKQPSLIYEVNFKNMNCNFDYSINETSSSWSIDFGNWMQFFAIDDHNEITLESDSLIYILEYTVIPFIYKVKNKLSEIIEDDEFSEKVFLEFGQSLTYELLEGICCYLDLIPQNYWKSFLPDDSPLLK